MRTALFCVMMWRVVVISYRLFEQLIGPETSVRNYHHSLCYNTEERSSRHFGSRHKVGNVVVCSPFILFHRVVYVIIMHTTIYPISQDSNCDSNVNKYSGTNL
jgi:hypothetical protein